jgi:hypothetical protein
MITQIYDHQSNLSQGGVPIMVVDAWEHAYYLQYKNEKAKFFDAVWSLWNWSDIASRFEHALKTDLSSIGMGKGGNGQRTTTPRQTHAGAPGPR